MNLKEFMFSTIRPVNTRLTSFILNRHYNGAIDFSTNSGKGKVLVLAPHMDDETIGAGGAIRIHANKGAEVHCVFVTDGSGSVSDLSKGELIRRRKSEIEAVKDILGIKQVHYLGLPDGYVESKQESRNKLISIIKQVKPDLIYSPLLVDAHPDHTATAMMLADVIDESKYDCTVRMYEINCAIPPDYINCLIDISNTLKSKQAAINEFSSQTIAFDGFLALNQYKTNLAAKPNVSAVEGFMEIDGDHLIKQRELLKNRAKSFKNMFKQINRKDTLLWAIFQNYGEKKNIYKNITD